jgi:nucleotide-binding universal stress UspA family protein
MDDGSTVLVPVDFSPHARAAAVRACEIARACDARVRLLHGAVARIEELESEDDEAGDTPPKSPRHELESWRADLESFGAPISAVVEDEDPIELIGRHAHAADVRLVVMGMHGFRGFDRVFLGSVADRALRSAQVPLMLVKESEHAASLRIHRILLATDFSPASEQALRLAIHWARRLQADVEVLHAIHESEAERDYPRPRDCASRSSRQRANALESLRSILSRTAAAGVRAVADLTYGAPSIEIVKHAARSRADLVVLGLRGETDERSARWGSVTERVIRHVKCSVLVAPYEPGEARRGPTG